MPKRPNPDRADDGATVTPPPATRPHYGTRPVRLLASVVRAVGGLLATQAPHRAPTCVGPGDDGYDDYDGAAGHRPLRWLRPDGTGEPQFREDYNTDDFGDEANADDYYGRRPVRLHASVVRAFDGPPANGLLAIQAPRRAPTCAGTDDNGDYGFDGAAGRQPPRWQRPDGNGGPQLREDSNTADFIDNADADEPTGDGVDVVAALRSYPTCYTCRPGRCSCYGAPLSAPLDVPAPTYSAGAFRVTHSPYSSAHDDTTEPYRSSAPLVRYSLPLPHFRLYRLSYAMIGFAVWQHCDSLL